MKHNIAKEWTKALRSRWYSQTTGQLYDGNEGYCCLGVLCKILGVGFAEAKFGCKGNGTLPIRAIELAGMKDDVGDLPLQYKYSSLADMNDSGMTFEAIADVIDENWEQL